MDPQSQSFIPYANINETWRLHTDLAKMQQLQAEHAERIARLERRQDDDARIKSVWGPSSPFPSVLGGNTPQHVPLQQSSVDQFRVFDDEANNMISSLHLDADDEPRRGLGAASRANSVRFDETANTNHFTHSSRASGEFISRASSSLGGLHLNERAMSHKSEGRASSVHSLRSAASGRANSLNMDLTYGPADSTRSPLETPGLAPGLLLLGAAPAIIRCWMTTTFKHDALLYAAICSGSYKSFLDMRLVRKLGFESVVRISDDGVRSVELPVFFPEAIPLTSSSRSSSPAPHLPSLLVEFRVIETTTDDADGRAIQIFIGSDVLRAHHADVLFSTNSMTIYDDERNKLSIPLARPEHEAAFNTLYIARGLPSAAPSARKEDDERSRAPTYLNGLGQEGEAPNPSATVTPAMAKQPSLSAINTDRATSSKPAKSGTNSSGLADQEAGRPASSQSVTRPSVAHNAPNGEQASTEATVDASQAQQQPQTQTQPLAQPPPAQRANASPATLSTWRRDGTSTPVAASSYASPVSSSALDWGAVAGRSRDQTGHPARRDPSGIKVLKPKTASSTARAFSSTGITSATSTSNAGASSPTPEGKSSRFFEEGRRRSAGPGEDTKVAPAEAKPEQNGISAATAATTPKTKSNPVGGASAFSWLNSAAGSSK